MMSLDFEEYVTLEKRCNDLLKDDQIRFAGVINKMGNLVAGGFRKDIEPFQNDSKQRMLYMQMVLEISMRREFDSDLGNINYTSSSRNKALMITVPINEKIVLVSSAPDASTKRIVAKINNTFDLPVGEANLMYKKILVPHAGTAAGNKALDHALEMGKKHGSTVTVLHVVENIPIPPSVGFSAERKRWAKELQDARRGLKIEMHHKLTKQANRLKKSDIPVSVKVVHGYPDEEIIRIANENDYDIVMMAKRRKLTGIKAILKLGSISRKVLEKISCPVMLIDGERK